ncbi:LysM peptidoglycan-binding domain-containing protein [Arthrobacter sp. AQ5-05]|uniref:LysM peptidoglycan-binding domain-containing protein n=1 Tax=Arthrobacter sp. AQ5-05 TaxID=2184581 RepID=UPI0018A7BEBB|nr:LysM peptidoglycan-binding domain-containing protein [Arthrobacter sp. AQ5-05]
MKTMKRQTGADLAMTAATLCLGGSLIFAGRSMLQRRLSGIRANGPLELDEVLGAVAAGTGIAVALWWALALGGAVVAALAEHRGAPTLAARTAALSPVFMRRLVAAVVGLNLLGAPMALATVPGAAPDTQQRLGATVSSTLLPGTAAGTLLPGTAPGTLLPSTAAGDDAINPAWTPSSPGVDPGPVVPAPTRSPPGTPGQERNGTPGTEVVVQKGDSLWSIVATTLGPYATDVEVALTWPQWYRANRAVIGEDPNHILPGQILHAPTG